MGIALLVVVFVLIFVIYVFRNTEYYDDYFVKYAGDVAVMPDAYGGLNLPEHLYLDEYALDYFTCSLDKVLTRDLTVTGVPLDVFDVDFKKSLSTSISAFMLNVLNADNDDVKKFVTLTTEIVEVLYYYTDTKTPYREFFVDAKSTLTDVYVVKSKLIAYRDSKIYGVLLDLTTVHDDKNLLLSAYNVEGFVFQDKLNFVEAANLTKHKKQIYHKDRPVLAENGYYINKEFEDDLICKHFDALKTDRGISDSDIATLCSQS